MAWSIMRPSPVGVVRMRRVAWQREHDVGLGREATASTGATEQVSDMPRRGAGEAPVDLRRSRRSGYAASLAADVASFSYCSSICLHLGVSRFDCHHAQPTASAAITAIDRADHRVAGAVA